MKEFDLKAALNGEPVMLRNGSKAIILNDLRNHFINTEDCDDVLLGAIYSDDGNELRRSACWNWFGLWNYDYIDEFDIVGMWEEPKPTSEQVLEKAYNDGLLVLCDGNPDLPLKVIAKTKNGEFVMQPEDDTIQPWLANLTMEWFFVKDPNLKFDTTTNTSTSTLPKPFKPKSGNGYYYINEYGVQFTRCYDEDDDSDVGMAENAQCYRTREDAQKWLDFMKSMME